MKNATIAIAVGHELGLTYNTIYQNLKNVEFNWYAYGATYIRK